MCPLEGQSTFDCGQEYLPLLFSIYRIPFEIDPYAEVGEQPRWVLTRPFRLAGLLLINLEPVSVVLAVSLQHWGQMVSQIGRAHV